MKTQTMLWMKFALRCAAIYNVTWGLWTILFPAHFFEWVGMEPMQHPMVWQGMGMVIGLYGLAYWWASYDPMRQWPVIAVGLLGNILGPVGFALNYLKGDVPFGFFYTLITNDFIWWIPFFLILKRVHSLYHWQLKDQLPKITSR